MMKKSKKKDQRLGKAIIKMAFASIDQNRPVGMTLDLGEHHGRVDILIHPETKSIH